MTATSPIGNVASLAARDAGRHVRAAVNPSAARPTGHARSGR
ncbi:hypothetical protein ODJ79_44495 [Actinoplanes sp. KI2]|nr:hypothetical protein [Actinoplanes sp. KI2]MCU7730818.1 hypothetical protein [Actinoplanes sp. KI2]